MDKIIYVYFPEHVFLKKHFLIFFKWIVGELNVFFFFKKKTNLFPTVKKKSTKKMSLYVYISHTLNLEMLLC